MKARVTPHVLREQAHVLARAEVGEQPSLLDEVAHAPPDAREPLLVERLAEDLHAPVVGLREADQHPQERRLPAPARPEEDRGLSPGDLEIDRPHGRPSVEGARGSEEPRGER
jgi:hypothetical protein